MEDYVVKDHKKLRKGFTTGTCAAAAAKGAALSALSGDAAGDTVEIITPGGVRLTLPLQTEWKPDAGLAGRPGASAQCAVKKDSGDDPDVTDGVMVFAKVTLTGSAEGKILISGGEGIGRVTKPGLACAVGEAAINPTPRRVIGEEVLRVLEEGGYEGGAEVEISIPDGVFLAKKTYNPRLGITGGISVLGTSGIVEPMSDQALIDTIKVEMNSRKAAGAEYLLITPGNYGETFLKKTMDLKDVYTVQCSNFLGESLDYAVELGFQGLLFTAHIGKLVKVAGGIMNTHSRYGDARMEILTAHAARLGADRETAEQLLSCVTTDEAIAVLDRSTCGSWQREETITNGVRDCGENIPSALRVETIKSILDRVDYHIKERVQGCMATGAVMFSNHYGYLGQTAGAAELIEKLEKGSGGALRGR